MAARLLAQPSGSGSNIFSPYPKQRRAPKIILSDLQKEILVDEVVSNYATLFSSSSSKVAKHVKWQQICSRVNACGKAQTDIPKLKARWEGMKCQDQESGSVASFDLNETNSDEFIDEQVIVTEGEALNFEEPSTDFESASPVQPITLDITASTIKQEENPIRDQFNPPRLYSIPADYGTPTTPSEPGPSHTSREQTRSIDQEKLDIEHARLDIQRQQLMTIKVMMESMVKMERHMAGIATSLGRIEERLSNGSGRSNVTANENGSRSSLKHRVAGQNHDSPFDAQHGSEGSTDCDFVSVTTNDG